jgi:hypothetical protein
MSRPIRLHIRELVLHGFDPRDRHRIAAAVHQELASMLSNRNAVGASTSIVIERLDAGTLAVQPRTPRGIGVRIARTMKGALRR